MDCKMKPAFCDAFLLCKLENSKGGYGSLCLVLWVCVSECVGGCASCRVD